MQQPAVCEVPDCRRATMVGVGRRPVWVCDIHYDSYLADAAALVARLKEAVTGARNV